MAIKKKKKKSATKPVETEKTETPGKKVQGKDTAGDESVEAAPSYERNRYEDHALTANGLIGFMKDVQLHAEKHDDQRAYRVSLTHPHMALVYAWLYPMAAAFVKRVCKDENEGAWLMADWRPKTGALHWYGIVSTTRSAAFISKLWSSISGAHWKGAHVEPIDDAEDPKSRNFKRSIAQRVLYAAKPVTGVDISSVERAVAGGAYAQSWTTRMGCAPVDGRFVPPVPEQVRTKDTAASVEPSAPGTVGARTCDLCHLPLPADADVRTKFHEECRYKKNKANEKAKAKVKKAKGKAAKPAKKKAKL